MTTEETFDAQAKTRIEEAIRLAEAGTSCELRVHIENNCPEDSLDRAAFIFAELNMHQTKFRNGVLIYVALKDRKIAIIGDAGINEYMEPNSWITIKDKMVDHFRSENIESGIVEAVQLVGERIKKYFPIQPGDKNELPNHISIGVIRRNDE